MVTIRDVLGKLTEEQREEVAKRRAKRLGRKRAQAANVEGLAASYRHQWPELLKDMNKTELAKAMTVLDANQLRVVALRAFDGREVDLTATKQTPKGIIEKLCHRAPEQLRKRAWKGIYSKMLQDVGWKSERVPEGLEDKVKLQRIFK